MAILLPPAGAHETLVYGVLSRDALPYREAARGMTEVLDATGSQQRTVVMGQAGLPPGQVPTTGVTVVPFGQRAADALPAAQWPSQVACMVLDPAGKSGVVLQHPAEARLQRVRRLLPNAATLGVLVAEGEEAGAEIRDLQQAARRHRFTLHVHAIDLKRPLAPQLEPLADRIDVLLASYDLRIHSAENAPATLLFSWRNRIPVIGASDAWTRAGALMSFDWDYTDLGRQCGEMAVRLPPQRGFERPVLEAPRRMPHSLNQDAARHFMIAVPADLLQSARSRY